MTFQSYLQPIVAMVVWVTLENVEACRAVGMTSSFGPLLVYARNYSVRNKFPSKFVYASCLTRLENDRICGKFLGDFGPRYDHGR